MRLGRARLSVKKPRLTPSKPRIKVSKREVIAALARLHNMSEEELKQRIEEALREAGVEASLKRGRLKHYAVYDKRLAEAVAYAVRKVLDGGTVTTVELSRSFGFSRGFVREKIIAPLRKMGVLCEAEEEEKEEGRVRMHG